MSSDRSILAALRNARLGSPGGVAAQLDAPYVEADRNADRLAGQGAADPRTATAGSAKASELPE